MNKIYKLLIVLIMTITITTITSCNDKNEMFKFETKIVNDLEVKLNEPFSIYVKTTNISGNDFNYEGSSTIVGATIYLKKGSNIIRPNDIPVTKDFRKMIFKKNDSIERIWDFEYDLIKEKGCSDLYIEFFEETKVIKNYVCVK